MHVPCFRLSELFGADFAPNLRAYRLLTPLQPEPRTQVSNITSRHMLGQMRGCIHGCKTIVLIMAKWKNRD